MNMIANGTPPKGGTDASDTSAPPTMAVIGGGPGGMFICHALETQKRELEAKGQDTSEFPVVKVFERADGPGGVWRSDRTHEDGSVSPKSAMDIECEEKKEDIFMGEEPKSKQRKMEAAAEMKTNMYSGLWTNGIKEAFEFYDYTFKDHWGDVRTPTFLPRKYILEYLIARVTKHCPDFFERYFSFRTTVKNVKYIEDIQKFRVSTYDATTDTETVEFFDKCVWAGGTNGVPNIPKPTWDLFQKGCFPGRMVHSCDTSTFKEDVKGKNVLMVGGGLSAEDLALMAYKEGVNKVYILCRNESAEGVSATRWPEDKVECITEMGVKSVKGREVTLRRVYYSVRKGRYIEEDSDDEDEEEITKVLSDIDTVIFCTGYKKNVGMLDPALAEALPRRGAPLSIPDGWQMEENPLMQKVIGDIHKTMTPHKNKVVMDNESYYPFSESLYKACFTIDNPNMMFVLESGDIPLMSIEIVAWMISKVVSNQTTLPSSDEMKKDRNRIVGWWLQYNTMRYCMDWKFQEKVDKHIEDFDVEDSEWDHDCDLNQWLQGEVMNQFKYPLSYIVDSAEDCDDDGDYSEYCNHYWKNDVINDKTRKNLDKIVYDTENEKDGWRTFRDQEGVEEIKSYFTGLKSKKLPKPWVEIDEDEKLW